MSAMKTLTAVIKTVQIQMDLILAVVLLVTNFIPMDTRALVILTIIVQMTKTFV